MCLSKINDRINLAKEKYKNVLNKNNILIEFI